MKLRGKKQGPRRVVANVEVDETLTMVLELHPLGVVVAINGGKPDGVLTWASLRDGAQHATDGIAGYYKTLLDGARRLDEITTGRPLGLDPDQRNDASARFALTALGGGQRGSA